MSFDSLRSMQTIKADVSQFLRVTRQRHRSGEDPFRVVDGLSQAVDGILRQLYLQIMGDAQDRVALVAVGGYGRRELCPYSDIDLLFLRDRNSPNEKIEKLVVALWDGGFQLGHSVRTVPECFTFMADDHITAAALLENRFLVGSRTLYGQFCAQAVNRYRKRHGENFARVKLAQLGESLHGEDRTIYTLAPHLKESPCCLRDIQRVLWIESVRKRLRSFDDLEHDESFVSDDVVKLREAYGFCLRVRCELHFTSGLKLDVLERDSLPDIAHHLGYEGEPLEVVERFMADYFRHARQTYRFLRTYLETGTRGRRFFSKLLHKSMDRHSAYPMVAEKNVLFPREAPDPEMSSEVLMEPFLLAARENLRLSESLCGAIRERVQDTQRPFEPTSSVVATFVEILRGHGHVARSLRAMAEAGVLSKILPEFQSIEGLVNFDGHHQFTVDEHTLHTLDELDRVEMGAEQVPVAFVRLAREIETLLPLRLAMLLHDIGKGLRGLDHTMSGGKTSVIICERLGLDEETTRTVRFLVYYHLRMFKISERRDFADRRVVESFARLVGSEDRLRMLYLMTYLDIRSVGPGTWTAWKGEQLHELYQRTASFLRTGKIELARIEEILDATELSEEDRRKVVKHCAMFTTGGYVSEILPRRMLYHIELVDAFLGTGKVQVGGEDFGEYFEIVICGRDRAHLFADLAGVLFAEGFNLLRARIFSRGDGVAIDTFSVEVADGMRVDVAQRVKRIRGNLQRIDARRIVVEDLIRRWARSYRFKRMQPTGQSLYAARVAFDNEASEQCTVIDVSARDRPGLLYDLARALSRLGLNVRTARVSTLSNMAKDAFYVVEADGEKISNPARFMEIEQTLIGEAQSPTSVLSGDGL